MNSELRNAIERFEAGGGAEAVETIRLIASRGDPDALNALAILTWSGNQVPSDPAPGRLLFQYAASLGHPQAALTTDYEGGETAFVRTGLGVRGHLGDVLLFRNTGEGDAPEPLSEHAGPPVTSGTKFLATRWVRKLRWTP